MISILAAILSLGNVVFDFPKTGSTPEVTKDTKRFFIRVARLLGVDERTLFTLLSSDHGLNRKRNRNSRVKSRSTEHCEHNRDQLAMSLYSRLFDWVVERVNQKEADAMAKARRVSTQRNMLCFVDAPGFEKQTRNSLEQLFVNVADEMLQQHFYEHVCSAHLEQLEKEELEIDSVVVHDAEKVLASMGVQTLGGSGTGKEKNEQNGVFQLLDQQTRTSGDDKTLLAKVIQDHTGVSIDYQANDDRCPWKMVKRSTELIQKPASSREFQVMHYMGAVSYDVDGVVRKNIDASTVAVIAQFLSLHGRSTIVRQLYPQVPRISSSGSSSSSTSF